MLTTVATYTTSTEAHILRGRLEVEGIPAYVVHEYHIGVNWFLANALGGIKVQTHESDTDAALAIIKEVNAGEHQAILEEQQGSIDDDICCPHCGSKSNSEIRWSEKISLIVFWLFSLPLPFTVSKRKCRECDEIWTVKTEKYYSTLSKILMLVVLFVVSVVIIKALYSLCAIYYLNPICIS